MPNDCNKSDIGFGGKRIECIRFIDDMEISSLSLIADNEERINRMLVILIIIW